jgi:hypothetical protein
MHSAVKYIPERGYVRDVGGEDRMSRIQELTDMLEVVVASTENQGRGGWWPDAVFVLEEPIASSQIFGFDVNRYFSDPGFYIEQTLRTKLWLWDNFPDHEAKMTMNLPAWLGYYPEFTFVGLGLDFTPDGIPLIQEDHPLSRTPNLSLLEPVEFYASGWMPRILRWWDELTALADPRLDVSFEMFWWRGGLDLAVQLRGYENLVFDMMDRPQFSRALLNWLVQQRHRWYQNFYEFFDLPVQPAPIADDWINAPFISPRMFEDYCLPCYREIEAFHGGIPSLHSCGNTAPFQTLMLSLQSLKIFENSPWTDLRATLANVPPEKQLQIAIHPNDVLFADEAKMEADLTAIVSACQGRHFRINTSGLTPILGSTQIFIDQINAWIRAARKILKDVRYPAGMGTHEGDHHFHSLS